MHSLIQAAIDAAGAGAQYALIAIGIALIFGVLRLINMAYGEIVIGSVFAGYYVQDHGLAVVITTVILAGITLSVATERLAFRPLRRADPTTMLIGSFAVSFIFQNAALATIGASPRGVGVGSSLARSASFGTFRVPGYTLVTVGAVIVIVVALRAFLTRSAVGIAMRAASEDFDAARLIGVKADVVILSAFAMSGLVAAVVGFLLVSQTGVVTPTGGLLPALLGFVAVVVGGMGSLPAAALGGLILGAFQTALQYLLPTNLLVFKDAMLFSLVLVILILRPQGLFVRDDIWKERV